MKKSPNRPLEQPNSPRGWGEVSATNNEHLFAVRVLKEKIKVLVVAGRPSFDLTFLKRALESLTSEVKELRKLP